MLRTWGVSGGAGGSIRQPESPAVLVPCDAVEDIHPARGAARLGRLPRALRSPDVNRVSREEKEARGMQAETTAPGTDMQPANRKQRAAAERRQQSRAGSCQCTCVRPSRRIHPSTLPSTGETRAMHSVCQMLPHTSPSIHSSSFSHFTCSNGQLLSSTATRRNQMVGAARTFRRPSRMVTRCFSSSPPSSAMSIV